MINDTTSDLEEHLQQIDEKLQAISLQGKKISNQDAVEWEQIQEERDCTQKCLDICDQVSAHIDQVQGNSFKDISTPPDASDRPVVTKFSSLFLAKLVTSNVLKECEQKLASTNSQLKTHLQDINDRLDKQHRQPVGRSKDDAAEQEKIREQLESVKQCLAICARASEKADNNRTIVFDTVSMADDGHQVIVATLGDLISARNITIGARSMQVMGQLTDETIQKLSGDRYLSVVRSAVTTEEEKKTGAEARPQFAGRYGTGTKLGFVNLTNDDTKQP
jgi:hypothetical protein